MNTQKTSKGQNVISRRTFINRAGAGTAVLAVASSAKLFADDFLIVLCDQIVVGINSSIFYLQAVCR